MKNTFNDRKRSQWTGKFKERKLKGKLLESQSKPKADNISEEIKY